jgi:Family of unknown function (DUF6494)
LIAVPPARCNLPRELPGIGRTLEWLSTNGAIRTPPSWLTYRRENAMENERFNLSLRRFLKEVGISSQQAIEEMVRNQGLAGKGKLKVKMVLTAEGADLNHVVNGEIDLG